MNNSSIPGSQPTQLSTGNWLAFAAVSIGSFLGPLSGSIVIVALPSIARELDVDVSSVKWVVLVYLVAVTFLLPLVGLLGKRLGAGLVFKAGFILFGLGSVLSALCPDTHGLPWLLASRFVQSIGAALLFGVNLALVTRVTPAARRGLAFGIIGSIVSLALITGQPLGVLICDTLGWRWVFWVQVPVALAGAVMTIRFLPADSTDMSVRIPGWNLLAWVVLVSSVTLVSEAYSKGILLAHVPLLSVLALAALAAFALLERNAIRLLDYTLFRHDSFWRGTVGALIVYLTMFAMMLFLPFYLEDFLALSTGYKTFFFALSPFLTVFFGPIAGWVADRWGYRFPVISGLALLTASYLVLAAAISSSNLVYLGLAFAMLGIGNGMFGSVNYSAMMSSARDSQRSQAASFCSLTRNVGFMLGTSLGSVLFGLLLANIGGSELMVAARSQQIVEAVNPDQFFQALRGVSLVCGGMVLVALLISIRYPNRAESS